MIRSIVTVGACIAALMGAVKDGRVLRVTGLTGACTVVRQTVDGSELAACRPGKLEGRPDLTRQGCKLAGTAGTYQYWSCPGLQTNR
jgi:hypothetical protein